MKLGCRGDSPGQGSAQKKARDWVASGPLPYNVTLRGARQAIF